MILECEMKPSRGRLYKLFTDLGPFFRKQLSTESLFFFDCLEICLDAEKEPSEREFYGWWLLLRKDENGYTYQRFNGCYNFSGDWVVETLSKKNQLQVDQSFELFIKRIETLLNNETGLKLEERQIDLAEA